MGCCANRLGIDWLRFPMNIILRTCDALAFNADVAPLSGELMMGRKRMSAMGSTHESMCIIPVSTTPGSPALTCMPRGASSCAKCAVSSVVANFERE